ncbi:tetratricopeptide repeat protein [uncultured Corynebacterium sp.]|uniref:tetratricopeptide repeat protein n=1 Tax=uncultured Corynebacterium sp. TaxID=159447 RepID=UPI0025FB64DF|nr:tetratricopeptide repeat protein [uncultured Corynebacterium sp.]
MTVPNRFVGGALDLGQVKAAAEARAKAEEAAAQAAARGESPAAGIPPFFQVTDENFESDVVRRSAQVPVVVLIGTPRSAQSEQLKADFAELAAAGDLTFLVGYIDADTHPQIAQAFGVRNLPTVVALAAGQPLTNFEGAQPREALEQWVGALVQQVGAQLPGLPGAAAGAAGLATDAAVAEEELSDPRLAAAESALNAGDFDAAIAAYDEILAVDPGAADIKQARGTVELLKRLQGVEDPVGRAAADPTPQAQMQAADAEVVAGAPERAFARLIDAMRGAPGDEKAALRDRLLELFGLFEAGDSRVLAARTQLASALY